MPAELSDVLAAIRSFRNADTELRRAIASGDAERQNKAGTRYAVAKIKLFAKLPSPLSSGEGG